MDANFADFSAVNFGSFPDEIQTNATSSSSASARASVAAATPRVYVNRPQVNRLSDVFTVTDGAKKPRGLRLELKSTTDEELDADIERMREEAVKIVTGSEAVPICDNRKSAKCDDRLECSHIWNAKCAGNHNTANGLLVHLLSFIYHVEETGAIQEKPKAKAADAFAIEEDAAADDHHGSYIHVPHPEQDYRICTKTRANITQANLRKLYREGIPDFFAGKAGCTMQRIGAHEIDKRIHKTDKDLWCRAPYCQRSLLAVKLVTVRKVPGNPHHRYSREREERRPACNRFHTYISSVLTNVIRSVLECEKEALPQPDQASGSADHESTPVKEPTRGNREPRAPYKAAAKPAKSTTPVVRRNVFSDLLDAAAASPKSDAAEAETAARVTEELADDAAEKYGLAMKSDSPHQAQLDELEAKLKLFDIKYKDGLKYNAELRDRRAKLQQQIAKQRALVTGKSDSFDD